MDIAYRFEVDVYKYNIIMVGIKVWSLPPRKKNVRNLKYKIVFEIIIVLQRKSNDYKYFQKS